MKPHYLKQALLLPTVLLSFSLISCVDPMYSGGAGGYSNNRSGFNTYSTLPPNYSGNAYLYNGRYYSGGQYQTGTYHDHGRQYSDRYYHNGQYYYGGQHRNYPGSNTRSNYDQDHAHSIYQDSNGSRIQSYPRYR